MNGTDSIQHLVDDNKIVHIPCPTFKAFDESARQLLTKVGLGDFIIVDTVTLLAETTRTDSKFGTDMEVSLWDQREKVLGDKNYLTVYQLAGTLIMKRLRNFRNVGARIITTTHEDEQRDDGTLMRKRAPAVNAALYRSLVAASSDVIRMQIVHEPITDAKGVIKVPAGVRSLQLKSSDDAVIKTHVLRDVGEKLPRFIYNPSWQKLCAALGKTPSWLLLYGPPGVGKTTLSTEMAEQTTLQPA